MVQIVLLRRILPLPFIKPTGTLHLNKTGILLSGGMDSIAIAYWKKPTYSFTIDYGQKPAISEIQAAKQISNHLGIEHHIITVDCSNLGSGDMVGAQPLSVAPVTEWWPYRNQLIITLACMKGIALGISEIIIGTVSTDISHKDGTKEFYDKIFELMKFQEGHMSIIYPAINMTSIDLIKHSDIPNSLLLWAHSCHTSNQPCMKCNGCNKYLNTLQGIGIHQ